MTISHNVAIGVTFGSQIITNFCGISWFDFRECGPLSYRAPLNFAYGTFIFHAHLPVAMCRFCDKK